MSRTNLGVACAAGAVGRHKVEKYLVEWDSNRVQHDQRPRRGLRGGRRRRRPGRRERGGAGLTVLSTTSSSPRTSRRAGATGCGIGLNAKGYGGNPGPRPRARGRRTSSGPAGERLGVLPGEYPDRLRVVQPPRVDLNDAQAAPAARGGHYRTRVRVASPTTRRTRTAGARSRATTSPARATARRRLGLRRRRRPVLLSSAPRCASTPRARSRSRGLLQAALRGALAADAAVVNPDVARRVRQRLGPGRQLRLRRRCPDEGSFVRIGVDGAALRHQQGGRASRRTRSGPRRQRDAAHGLHAGPGRVDAHTGKMVVDAYVVAPPTACCGRTRRADVRDHIRSRWTTCPSRRRSRCPATRTRRSARLPLPRHVPRLRLLALARPKLETSRLTADHFAVGLELPVKGPARRTCARRTSSTR